MASTIAALLLAFLGLPPSAQEGAPADQRKWIETVVPRMASAEAQLGHARRLRRQMGEKRGAEQAFWRKLAVEAYQAVRVFHGDARAACVESAFRAGEILRAGGAESEAMAEFRWSAQHGERSEFRARALLEIGHLHRRGGRWREALEAYLDVGADVSAAPARRDDAWLWAGTVWKALERPEDARTAWRRVAEHGSDALARIRAFDELGLLLLEGDDLEGAAGVLEQCMSGLAAQSLEETEEGERVRSALLRMRLVDELPRAIARRKDSSAEHGTSRKSLTR